MEEKKIRIVFLCRDYGKVSRGVESHVEELAKRLESDFEVEIFSGKDADDLKKVVDGKFDLVIPANGRMQLLKMSLGRLLSNYKILTVGHAGIGRDEIWNLLMRPDVYVALTDAEMRWARQFSLGVSIVKIPNGIDLEKFFPRGKNENFHLEIPIILSVGALEWYKYHDLAIKAVARLPKVSLLIVGRGSKKEELKDLGSKLLGEKRFKIMDMSYDKMPEVYRSTDLFTLPSWDREAFGIVYLEAMASGLGVVAPDDLSRREIVGEAGIFTDVFDIDKYAAALEKALKTNWENLPQTQAEKFAWDKIADQYKSLIRKICR